MSRLSRSNGLPVAILLLAGVHSAAGRDVKQGSYRIEGTVKDQSGAFIPHAEVILRGKKFHEVLFTDPEGRFSFRGIPVEAVQVTVTASGFAPDERTRAARDSSPLAITLVPLAVVERVTVSATRTQQRVSDTAASATVLSEKDLAATCPLMPLTVH